MTMAETARMEFAYQIQEKTLSEEDVLWDQVMGLLDICG